MNILIVLAHPKTGSFNHALANSIRDVLQARGDQVTLRDLYAENFDPVMTPEELERDNVAPPVIREHADAVLAADGIVIVHPNWRSQPPAILKGWIDRVLRAGEAFRFVVDENGKGKVVGMLKARAALVINTSNTPEEVERAVYGDPLETLWKNCTWSFCGIPKVERRNFNPVIVSTPETRQAWLEEAATLALEAFV
ncbi:Putative NADPH-quinone reductase (modulator of drug activity B) [Formivibrio citricus]|uniref:NADPH-quinone reductase (Modulator of drug activity B) n=1 Tax=Formivibrio citricus TaxID=83765 RepID=A0A1I5A4J4_9NEIS|nr:NAD(P)H-dependent oxidoreductase [Formivibrio citricus]SFN57362.1 Putative NADPH-quinone reductase (modulator of drug activity B) [Formivibrio citricus]